MLYSIQASSRSSISREQAENRVTAIAAEVDIANYRNKKKLSAKLTANGLKFTVTNKEVTYECNDLPDAVAEYNSIR